MGNLGAYIPRLHARWLAGDPAEPWAAIDGSLVFADISGFTPLSERLARQGKGGAEVLTDVVNDVVGRLLGVTAELGGDLLKYGGDALLVLFTGDGHGARAAAAAHDMQTALRRGPARQDVGVRVRLRMSIGVDGGPFHLSLAGSSHRELIVAGPAVTRVAALEAAADAGEVLVGARLAATLPIGAVGEPKVDGVLLRRRPAVTGGVEPGAPVDPDLARGGIPEALRDLGTVDGEHRQAVVAFVQFSGSDDLLTQEGPAALAAALDELVSTTQISCAAHGVTFLTTDLDKNAGKLILVAGAPTTAGDDDDRMLLVVRDVLDGRHRLPLRAGIHRGPVFAVEVGTPERRVYTVMGDTVNQAARVMGAAPIGSCLATLAVIERLATEYQLDPVEPFQVKGKSEPVVAALVGAALGVRAAGIPVAGAPLVGREEELSLLAGAVADARGGQTRVVELVGDPGIGKSRLIAELCTSAADLPIVVVEGSQYASTTPYRAVRDAARALVGLPVYASEDTIVRHLRETVRTAAPELAPWLPLLVIPFGASARDTPETAAVAPEFRRNRIEEVTGALCAALMPKTGVLVVEDAHWLDEGSAELVLHLVRALRDEFHWVVCVGRRSVPSALDLSDVPALEKIELGPLPEDHAAGVLGLTGRRFTQSEVRALVERAAGNPLFLQELAAAAVRGTSVDELPDNVEALIAAHIDTLAPVDRRRLRVASVLGLRFPTDLLNKLADDPEAGSRSALRRMGGLLQPDGDERLRFRQALVREVAYEGLAYRRRRELHGRAAELVEAFEGPAADAASAALSLHYFAAGRHAKAFHWSRVAGERARAHAAPAEAAAFFDRAVDAGGQAHVGNLTLAETNESLGDVCELGGQYDRAATAYRRARRLLGDQRPEMFANLLRKQGWVNERTGRYGDALRWYTRGFRATDQLDPTDDTRRLKAELLLAYGAVRIRQGRHRDAVPLLEDAVRHAEEADAPATLAHAYYDLDWAWTELGQPDPRYRALALPIFEQLGDWLGQGNTLNNLGLGAYYEGRWEEAVSLWRRARDAFERVGDVVQQATIANNIGEILSDQGHLDEAEAEFRAAVDTWEDARFPVGIGLATSNLGRLAARRGRFDTAEDLLAAAVEQLRAIGAGELAWEAVARQAELRLLSGRHDEAGELAEAVLAQANRPTLLAQVERSLGYASVQAGELSGGLEWLRRSLATAEVAGAQYEAALTRQAIVRVGRIGGRAVKADRVADDILARLGVVRTNHPPLDDAPEVVGRT